MKRVAGAEEGILRSAEFEGLVWDEEPHQAAMSDVLRVHEWAYVRRLQNRCAALADEPTAIGFMDGDTAFSRDTFNAALAAAGASCCAVDRVISGEVSFVQSLHFWF